ncbi:MAG: aldehyde dehydrogenase [Deltaproteobacteria bacterium]|nr:aldehyde dehydrogenase [Deltaproteobacteria bacterium]
MSSELKARLALLQALAERLAARRDDLAVAAGRDIGTPHWIATLEVDLAVDYLRTMEVEAANVFGKRPFGLVAAIFPYDAAPVMLARVGGSALLAGNRFRFSCSSQTPETARILKEVVQPLPEVEAVTDQDNRAFGERCVADPEVRVFFISGGGEVGSRYARKAQAFDKLFFAGPSGLPPVILFRDAPLRQAVTFLVRRAFLNGGQYCTCPKRAYIHRDLYPEVRRLVLELMADIRVGEPEDPATWIGPIRVARTRALLDRALAALAQPRFLLPYQRDGVWQGPFLVETPETPDLELFGPFLALCPVASDEEAVKRVLRSRYPMLISFFGTPPAGAVEKLHRTFGMVFDNPDFLFTPLRLPFGGRGESGWVMENRQGRLWRRDGALIYSQELIKDW